MALTIKQLNGDTSFLLSLEPIADPSSPDHLACRPFTILLDPWITGPSKTIHSRFSLATHRRAACISSLSELDAPPDLVIISNHQSDHCNEATLRQLPASGTKTLILASPKAAKVILGWRYFDKDKVRALQPWEDPRVAIGKGREGRERARKRMVRLLVPTPDLDGSSSEVTVAFIPQRKDAKGLHAAVGITYRPPSTYCVRHADIHVPVGEPSEHVKLSQEAMAAQTPMFIHPWPGFYGGFPDRCFIRTFPPRNPLDPKPSRTIDALLVMPPTPPCSPLMRPLRSVRSTATLASQMRASRCVSVVYSPHGIEYGSLEAYATSHLVAEAAIPLTALLHCWDAAANPWWLGGSVSAGLPAGQAIAGRLGARVWVSAHDGGNKETSGLATRWLSKRVYGRDEVIGALDRESGGGEHGGKKGSLEGRMSQRAGGGGGGGGGGMGLGQNKKGVGATEVLTLGVGEEVVVTSQGIWTPEAEGMNGEEGDHGRDTGAVSSGGGGSSPFGGLLHAQYKPTWHLQQRQQQQQQQQQQQDQKQHGSWTPERKDQGGVILPLRTTTTTTPPEVEARHVETEAAEISD